MEIIAIVNQKGGDESSKRKKKIVQLSFW